MAELIPDLSLMLPISNAQRHDAALALAARHGEPHVLAYYLVQLGLAVHRDDGSFASVSENGQAPWFSPRPDRGGAAFRVPAGMLDDCR